MKVRAILIIFLIAFGVKGQIVNIPDTNFKSYLVGNPSINTNGNSEIEVSEAASFNGDIICPGMGISDMTGVEAFPQIINLRCYNNAISTLDLSNNISLVYLHCYETDISSLDLSNNVNLLELIIPFNPITNIDLSNNINLKNSNCKETQITSLDLSENINLTTLQCQNNQLIELNIANGNNTNFTLLATEFNPNLTCIQVDDPSYSESNWEGDFFLFDSMHFFSDYCVTGSKEEHINTISIYPNPSSSHITIETENRIDEILIYNPFGELVATELLSNFSIESLPNGVYLIHVKTDRGNFQGRFIKK